MIYELIGKKIGMTQIFTETGHCVPVSVIKTGPCSVIQIKTKEKDGYNALKVGFDDIKENKLNKPDSGQFTKSKTAAKRVVKEIKWDGKPEVELGQEITVDIFEKTKKVDVTGISKGKGFAGVMKRHKFKGGPKTHGQSNTWRTPGSIGAAASPSRVFKGMKMAGKMGNKTVTVQSLDLIEIDNKNNLLLIKGAVPGHNNSILKIKAL